MSQSQQTLDQICSLVTQQRLVAQYNNPINRFTITSPYPTYTQDQLNMRRKVEILKYKSSNQNSKSNGFTKSHLWSQLVSGKSRNNVSQYTLNKSADLKPCDTQTTNQSISTGSDVPGPPIYLQLDNHVPLYNLTGVSDRIYTILNNSETTPYYLYTKNSDELSNITNLPPFSGTVSSPYRYEVPLGVIIVNKNIPSNMTTFNFTTPLAFWCTGTASSSGTTLPSLNISMNSVVLNVYYNGVLVTNTSSPPLYSTITYNTNYSPVIINNISTNSPFYAIQYLGNLAISNLTLSTPQQIIYELKLGVRFSYSYTGNFSSLAIGVFDTLNSKYITISKNCSTNSSNITGYVASDFVTVST